MSWAKSTRKQRLPPNWSSTIQPAILARDGNRCYVCGGYATEVDHVVRGDNHHPSNLAAICTADHRRKTAREGVQARSTTRPAERHPGLR